MGSVVSLQPHGAADLSSRQIDLIKRTIASDTNGPEFDLFIEVAKRVGLDPFRRQIMPLVFSKSDPAKRRMSLVTGIDGFRVIASRCADYRPDEKEPVITYDAELKSTENPLGIVKASVTAFKQDSTGAWHPVNGVAYWEEYVPLKDDPDAFDWVETGEVWENTGRPKKKKVRKAGTDGAMARTPDGQWAKMPRVMIAKCAEAQALRKGWPEHFSGLYDPAELDRAQAADMSASELVEIEAEQRRMTAISGRDTLIVDWPGSTELDRVPIGQFADRVLETVRTLEPVDALAFRDRNRQTFNEFWAKAPTDAIELKKVFERIEKKTSAVTIDHELPPWAPDAQKLKTLISGTETNAELDALKAEPDFAKAFHALPENGRREVAAYGEQHRATFNLRAG